jgi:hypothetical protein
MTNTTKTFRCRLYDRRGGGEIGHVGGEVVEAQNRTEARKFLAKEWARDTPRDARNFGFVPFRDVKIVWVE